MAKAIREFQGKELLSKYVRKLVAGENGVGREITVPFQAAPVDESTDFGLLVKSYPWLETQVCIHVYIKNCREERRGGRIICLHCRVYNLAIT